MRLEIATFPVRNLDWASRSRFHDGQLELCREEILDLVLADPHIEAATTEIARPGDSTRIINFTDKIEPRVKVNGPGTTYPGILGRSTDRVGTGRTHRVGGMAVIECVDVTGVKETVAGESRAWARGEEQRVGVEAPAGISDRFVDMSGLGAVTPYSSLFNLCLVVRPSPNTNAEEQHVAAKAGAMRVADRISGMIKDSEPHVVEVFDTELQPNLPGVVFIVHLSSTEPQLGARASHGTAVYGQTRLSAPWLLEPTEIFDGAIAGGGHTWVMVNNPVVLSLCRRHGKDVNFLGCIIQRTNWTSQIEYQLMAHRAALLAKRLGADGAVIATDVRGQRWVGTMLTVQACEQQGVRSVLLTEEEDNEGGTAPSLLFSPPELQWVVSTGTGDVATPFPPVSRVIGTVGTPPEVWFEELPPIHGRYGIGHVGDWYGIGKQSYADF